MEARNVQMFMPNQKRLIANNLKIIRKNIGAKEDEIKKHIK